MIGGTKEVRGTCTKQITIPTLPLVPVDEGVEGRRGGRGGCCGR